MSRRARAVSGRAYPWTGLDPDRRNAVLLVAGIALVIVFVLALIAYGYYTDRIAPDHETILEVGGRKFDYSYVERRAGAEAQLSRIDPTNIVQAIGQVVDTIEREELLRQAAPTADISATDEEIDARVRDRLALRGEVSREVYAARLRGELLRLDLSLAEYRDIARADVLQRKLRARFDATIPPEVEQADLRLIQLGSQSEALQARARLQQGDSFVRVAVDLSQHFSKDNGGQLGWVPRGALEPRLEEAAFGPEGVSDVIETAAGFFILETRAKEVRAVDTTAKAQITERNLSDLIQQTRDRVGSRPSLTIGQAQRLASSLRPGG